MSDSERKGEEAGGRVGRGRLREDSVWRLGGKGIGRREGLIHIQEKR